jgi:hypothetical protein
MDAERFLSRHGRDIDPELEERPVRDETAERMENRHTSIDVTFKFRRVGQRKGRMGRWHRHGGRSEAARGSVSAVG